MTDFQLALRFAFSGRAGERARAALVIAASAIGVVLMLGVLAVSAAPQMQSRRTISLTPLNFGANPGNTLMIRNPDTVVWDSTVVEVLDVRAGQGRLLPPGVAQLPGPGEMVASPALAELIRDEPPLAETMNARVVGTIANDGLVRPRELRAYRGAMDGPGFTSITSFGLPDRPGVGVATFGSGRKMLDLTTVVMVFLGLPLLVLTAAATRLSASSRDRRLAGLRLLGLSAKRVRRVAAEEAAVLGALGSVVGGLAFLALRQVAARLSVARYSWHADDLQPWTGPTIAVLVGVPLASVIVALAPAWRLSWFPMRMRRPTGGAPPPASRVVPLLVGLLLLLLGATQRALRIGDATSSDYQSGPFLVGFAVTALGLGLLIPFALRSSAEPLTTQSSRMSLRRIGRPLRHARSSGLRVLAALGGTLLVAGAVLLVPSLTSAAGSSADLHPVFVVAGTCLTGLGLILAIPWVLRGSARWLARRTSSPALHLGGRAVEGEPAATSRLVAGLTIAVFLCALAQSLLVRYDHSPERAVAELASDPTFLHTALLEVPDVDVSRPMLESLPGIRQATPFRLLVEADTCEGPVQRCTYALVATCAELAVVTSVSGCREGEPAWISRAPRDAPIVLTAEKRMGNADPDLAPRVRVASPQTSIRHVPPQDYTPVHTGGNTTVGAGRIPYFIHLVLPPEPGRYDAVLAAQPTRYLVEFTGGINTLSRLSLLLPHAQFRFPTVAEVDLASLVTSTRYRATLWSVTGIAIVVGFLALAITGIDHVITRRRRDAMLLAVGVPRRVQRRSQFWQLLLTGGLSVALASVLGLAAGVAVLSLDQLAGHAPVWEVGVVLLGGLLVAALTSAAPTAATGRRVTADDLRRE